MKTKLTKDFEERIKKLEGLIEYTFRDKSLPLSALTHRSFAAEYSKKLKDYEVLEFLGDAVISLIVSEILIKAFPEAKEGELSQIRSAVVSETYLSKLARIINLNELVLLSKGEIQQKGMERESLLCDVFEAVFGAVYVDCGYFIDPPRQIFNRLFKEKLLKDIEKGDIPRDYKSLLQIIAQKVFGITPKYKFISAEGPEHEKTFTMECVITEDIRTQGTGRSKKEAETKAAKKAYLIIKEKSEKSRK